MDFEALFLNDFSIQRKPDNLLDLIERAVAVAEFQYPAELEKRRNRIIKSMLHPGKLDYDDDDTSTLDDEEEEEEEDCVGDEDEVTNVEEEDCGGDEVTNVGEVKQQITNQKPTMKIKLIIKKSVQAAPLEKHNNCNATEELKKRSEDKQLDANKEGTRQSHSTTTMGSRKRNVPTQVAPPRKKLLSDFSFEKQLDGDKQLKKQSLKGFKKMENLTGNKKEERKECTSALTKDMPPPLMKMNVATKHKIVAPTPHQKLLLSDCSPKKQSHKGFKKMENLTGNKSEERKGYTSALTKRMPPPLMKMNVATKRKIVSPTPHQKQLLSDCSPKKQSNGSAIMRPMQKTTQSSEVVRPMQKETESIRDRNMKFESSKRKFEERFAEQREAKRRIIMVDFHDMPKPANDPCAPRQRCWNRRRF